MTLPTSSELAEAFAALSSFAEPRKVPLRIGDLERQLAHRTREQATRIFGLRT